MLHTDLPIHRAGVQLLAFAIEAQAQMPRAMKRHLGEKIVSHCTEMLDLMALANATLKEERAQHIHALLKHQRATIVLLLADAGVTAADVGAFWRAQPFDLGLPNMNGVTMHGNCDLCFLKPAAQVFSLIQERPERAVWWARMESSITNAKIQNGGRFRSDRASYAQMAEFAAVQGDLYGHDDEEALACFCGE